MSQNKSFLLQVNFLGYLVPAMESGPIQVAIRSSEPHTIKDIQAPQFHPGLWAPDFFSASCLAPGLPCVTQQDSYFKGLCLRQEGFAGDW
jgi:hypothetical protein